jgi:hypothetical protein
MNELGASPRMDPVLVPFLYTEDEREIRQRLDELIARATPDITKITRSSRTPEDAFQEAAHRVVKQLRELRAHRNSQAIGNYPHYVKVVASRVVKGQVRKEHPKRRSLVDSLRHVLKCEPHLADWESNGRKLCGFALWRDQKLDRTHSERLIRLLEEPRTFEDVVSAKCDPANLKHSDLLQLLFEWIGHPVRFDQLATIVCGLKRIEDLSPITSSAGAGRGLSDWLPDKRPRPDEYAEWKEFLGRLWNRIEQLPPLHRLAYLLNFTAADGQLELFWIYGIASIRRIGTILQITKGQFARAWEAAALSDGMRSRAERSGDYDEKFAFLWQMLPLSDAVIARMLGTERQKVINLRKAAADRLSRNMIRSDKANSC